MGGFAKKILEGLDGVYQVEVKKVIGMDKVEEGWREYMNEMNKGKIVIKPWEDL
jgi:NADPH:quinone reductase-like Zn-dependent oxidoreductase